MSNDILNSLLKEYDQKKLKAELECDESKELFNIFFAVLNAKLFNSLSIS